MDIVEPHYERSKYHHLNEREEEVAEDAAQEVDVRRRIVRLWRQDNENEARAEYLAQEHAQSSEKSEGRDPEHFFS